MGNKSSQSDAATEPSVYEDRAKALSELEARRIEVDRQRLNWLLVNCNVEQLQEVSNDAKNDLEDAKRQMDEAFKAYESSRIELESKQDVIDKQSGANNWDTPTDSERTERCGEFKNVARLYYKYRKSKYVYEAHLKLDKDVSEYLKKEKKVTERVSKSIQKSEREKLKIDQEVRRIQNIPPTVPTYQVGAAIQSRPPPLTSPPPPLPYNNQIQYSRG